MSITLTVLIENTLHNPSMKSQHGLSCWLDTGAASLLVDTGQDAAFLQNAERLHIPVSKAAWLMLTHGHYDHTGGVPALLAAGARPTVVIHPAAWTPRQGLSAEKPPHPIGILWPASLLAENALRCLPANQPLQLMPGVWSTGTIQNHMNMLPSPTLLRAHGSVWIPDTFPDEQALILHTIAGLVIITGCCHTGVLNTILAAQQATGATNIYALVGGLHLHAAAQDKVADLAESLRHFNLQRVLVNHCTGEAAYSMLRERLGARVEWAGTGYQTELPPLIAQKGA